MSRRVGRQQAGRLALLVVYAPFEPVPLQGMLGAQGFRFIADEMEGGDWRTTFVRE